MIRLLNILALIAVIGSATWAYSVKYETILVAEKLRKREGELKRERDAIALLKAEWHLLNRPSRLELLAKPEEGMQTLSAKQVVHAGDVPLAMPDKGDRIDELLTGSIPTPDSSRKHAAHGNTPSGSARPASSKDRSGGVTTGALAGARKSTTIRTGAIKAEAVKTPAHAKVAAAGNGKAAPIRLVPPARIGESAPPPRAAGSSTNPLTGFLNKIFR